MIFLKRNLFGTMSLSSFQDDIQFLIEIKPELELFLGIGLVRNGEYIGIYFNLTALNDYIKGMVRNSNFRYIIKSTLD